MYKQSRDWICCSYWSCHHPLTSEQPYLDLVKACTCGWRDFLSRKPAIIVSKRRPQKHEYKHCKHRCTVEALKTSYILPILKLFVWIDTLLCMYCILFEMWQWLHYFVSIFIHIIQLFYEHQWDSNQVPMNINEWKSIQIFQLGNSNTSQSVQSNDEQYRSGTEYKCAKTTLHGKLHPTIMYEKKPEKKM